MNKKEKQKNVFNDLFGAIETIEHIEEVNQENAVEELKNNKSEKDVIKSKKTITIRKNYNLPKDLVEDMEKIVYMDRDLKDNTELIIKALRKYIDSKACRDLLEEYHNLKGVE
mgnify:CR=1 FL=1